MYQSPLSLKFPDVTLHTQFSDVTAMVSAKLESYGKLAKLPPPPKKNRDIAPFCRTPNSENLPVTLIANLIFASGAAKRVTLLQIYKVLKLQCRKGLLGSVLYFYNSRPTVEPSQSRSQTSPSEFGINGMAERLDSIGLDTFVSRRNDLVALANKLVQNQAVAEELVQDSWIQWSSKSYPTKDAGPIFSRIVLNLSRDWLRKQKREWIKLESFSLLFDTAPDTERVVIGRQDLLNVMRALQQLPPKSLKAFRLSRVEEMTFAQIGEEMGIARSTAYDLVSQALVRVALFAKKNSF